MKQKGCLLLIVIFVAFVIVIVLQLPKSDNYDSPYFRKLWTGVLGKVSFKGRVIDYEMVHNEQFGKDYSVICIKLDYSNTDSIYYFQDKNALRIKDSIATIPGGVLVPGQIPVYLEVNMNNNYRIIAHFADGSTETYPLNFNYTGLSKEDLNYCN